MLLSSSQKAVSRLTLVLCPSSLMLLLVTRDFPRGPLGRSAIDGCSETNFSAPKTFSSRSKRPVSRRCQNMSQHWVFDALEHECARWRANHEVWGQRRALGRDQNLARRRLRFKPG